MKNIIFDQRCAECGIEDIQKMAIYNFYSKNGGEAV
jgi:hypothetical protein